MREYLIHSTKLGTDIRVIFNDDGLLVGFAIDGNLTEGEHSKMMRGLPHKESELDQVRKFKGVTVTEMEPDLSFETFYNSYGYKVSKLEAERAWNKLNKSDKLKALKGIRRYIKSCENSRRGLCHPSTYLNKRRWEDEV